MDVGSLLARLFSTGVEFDRLIGRLRRRRKQALPPLVRLLKHPDPGWRLVAAAALGRLRRTPPSALPGLLRLLRSPDASAKVAALSAMDWLPRGARDRAVPAVAKLLASRPTARPMFTEGRAQVPRAVAAHFLGSHGGRKGVAALQRAARDRRDPMIHHIDAALRRAAARSVHGLIGYAVQPSR